MDQKKDRQAQSEGEKRGSRAIKRRPSDWVDEPCVTSVKC